MNADPTLEEWIAVLDDDATDLLRFLSTCVLDSMSSSAVTTSRPTSLSTHG